MELGDLDPNGPRFHSALLDPVFNLSTKRVGRLIVAIFAPWYPLGKAAGTLYGGKAWGYMLVTAIPFYLCVVLEILQVLEPGLAYVGWSVLFGFFAYGTGIRSNMREKYAIHGNIFEDFFAMLLLYPLAAMQMDDHMEIAAALRTPPDEEMGVSNDDSDLNKSVDNLCVDDSAMEMHQRHVNCQQSDETGEENVRL